MSSSKNVIRRVVAAPLVAILLAAGLLSLSACDVMSSLEGNGTDSRLKVRLIDAPFPFDLVESANVTITRVDVHGEATGATTISSEEQAFNLLDLRNGVSALLGDVQIQPDTYHEARLYVQDASIVLKDGTTFDMKVPSERIKVLLDDIQVAEGQVVTLTLDFDVSQSFVVQGNPNTPAGINGFIFKPTVLPAGVTHEDAHDDDPEEGDDSDEGDDSQDDGAEDDEADDDESEGDETNGDDSEDDGEDAPGDGEENQG